MNLQCPICGGKILDNGNHAAETECTYRGRAIATSFPTIADARLRHERTQAAEKEMRKTAPRRGRAW